jgi:excisionase family DNA binding protein
MTEYYSPNEVAKKLGLKPATIRRYVNDNTMPHFRVGGKCIRISDEDLNNFLSRYRHGL